MPTTTGVTYAVQHMRTAGACRKPPARVSTESAHPVTFPTSHLFSALLSQMNPPRYMFPVTTLIPTPQKNSSAWATLNTFAKIWVVAPSQAPRLQVPKMHQYVHKLFSGSHIPTWRVIAPRWHDRKVTPPRFPPRVLADATV